MSEAWARTAGYAIRWYWRTAVASGAVSASDDVEPEDLASPEVTDAVSRLLADRPELGPARSTLGPYLAAVHAFLERFRPDLHRIEVTS